MRSAFPLRLGVVTLSCVLAASACSSGAAEYEFAEVPEEPTSSLVIRLPQEVVDQSEDYQQERVFEAYTVTGVEAEDSSRCAAEIEFEYAEGGLERLVESVDQELAATPTSDKTTGERMASDLTSLDNDGEMAEDYSSAVVPRQCAVSPQEADETLTLHFRTINDKALPDSIGMVEVALMSGGDLVVVDSEIEDWQMDANGNWISTD
ncbi:hypothetical protein KGD82_27870 (plasmid) [Nocardiopsis eucommiae]|uniref:Lipoprotein n=1 Tax=Nocardiopsis eucommiae TaxID=2831970 RepID=A0A975QMD5_9ACTN|nr:hypothetical protein KGD82_27870 [Nocardiopsis eucommiae]